MISYREQVALKNVFVIRGQIERVNVILAGIVAIGRALLLSPHIFKVLQKSR